ncbi:MAG TPA: PAS domain-containing sensor histidine kinase [Candidatus Sulfotelmatobacter sp.]|nr:PAS domain-containing sensor histidine kinase [Candidatus Sulfotelmatobacter sp.]
MSRQEIETIIHPHTSAALERAESRLQQSDEVFRLLVDSVKDYAIFLLDPSGRVMTWNQGAEKIKGYKAGEIIGEHFSRFYPQEARESRWPDRELEIAAREGRFADEGLRIRKDGSSFWAHVVITALRDKDGELRGFSKVTRDLSERKVLEERTRQLNKELRTRVAELTESQRQVELRTLELQRLSAELMRVQDEERRRMARTLHDDLGQELTALKIDLEVIRADESGEKPDLKHSLQLAESALRKVRNMSYLLHPPLLEESGLLPALHWYFDGLQSRGQLRITFDYKPVLFPRLPREIENAIFRVIQESLTNIYRHSQSQDARIDLIQEPDAVTVRIRDFGKGFPDLRGPGAPLPGVGISGMRERVHHLDGELKISNAEPGALVQATIPLVEPATASL